MKYVVHTTQVVHRAYYVETDDVNDALDGIVMGEIEEYAQVHLTEDIVQSTAVDEFDIGLKKIYPLWNRGNVMGAVNKFIKDENGWRWEMKAIYE